MEDATPRPAPLSYSRYLLLAGAVVTAVFVVIGPSGSEGIAPMARIPFWLLHVFGALGLFVGAQRVVQRVAGPGGGRSPAASWFVVAVSGVVGGVLFAPLALALEQLFPFGDPVGLSEDGVSLFAAIVDEATHVVPASAIVWIVLNAPWLLRLDFRPQEDRKETAPGLRDDEAPPIGPPSGRDASTRAPISELPAQSAPEFSGTAEQSDRGTKSDHQNLEPGALFVERLPAALGREIVALSSELHYLRVYTPRGNALILHTLRDAIEQMPPDAGLRVHRAHWVAARFVRRVRRRGGRVTCELEGGLEIPVSRRQQAEVLARFGDSATFETAGRRSSDR